MVASTPEEAGPEVLTYRASYTSSGLRSTHVFSTSTGGGSPRYSVHIYNDQHSVRLKLYQIKVSFSTDNMRKESDSLKRSLSWYEQEILCRIMGIIFNVRGLFMYLLSSPSNTGKANQPTVDLN